MNQTTEPKVLLPCLRPQDQNLAQAHQSNLFRKYLRQKIRPTFTHESQNQVKISDGKKYIEKNMGPCFWTPWELIKVDGEFLMEESDPVKIQNDLATFADQLQLFNEFENSFGSDTQEQVALEAQSEKDFILRGSSLFPKHEPFKDLADFPFQDLRECLFEIVPEKNEMLETAKQTLDILFDAETMISCLSTKKCDESSTSLSKDLEPLERPLPGPVSLPWSSFDESTLFGRRLTKIEFEDSDFVFEDTSNLSFCWNYLLELAAFVVEVSEAQLLKPDLVPEVESDLSQSSAATGCSVSDFLADDESDFNLTQIAVKNSQSVESGKVALKVKRKRKLPIFNFPSKKSDLIAIKRMNWSHAKRKDFKTSKSRCDSQETSFTQEVMSPDQKKNKLDVANACENLPTKKSPLKKTKKRNSQDKIASKDNPNEDLDLIHTPAAQQKVRAFGDIPNSQDKFLKKRPDTFHITSVLNGAILNDRSDDSLYVEFTEKCSEILKEQSSDRASHEISREKAPILQAQNFDNEHQISQKQQQAHSIKSCGPEHHIVNRKKASGDIPRNCNALLDSVPNYNLTKKRLEDKTNSKPFSTVSSEKHELQQQYKTLSGHGIVNRKYLPDKSEALQDLLPSHNAKENHRIIKTKTAHQNQRDLMQKHEHYAQERHRSKETTHSTVKDVVQNHEKLVNQPISISINSNSKKAQLQSKNMKMSKDQRHRSDPSGSDNRRHTIDNPTCIENLSPIVSPLQNQIHFKSLDIRSQCPVETRPPGESFDLRLLDKSLFPSQTPTRLPELLPKIKSKFSKSPDFSFASSQFSSVNLAEPEVEDDWLKPAKNINLGARNPNMSVLSEASGQFSICQMTNAATTWKPIAESKLSLTAESACQLASQDNLNQSFSPILSRNDQRINKIEKRYESDLFGKLLATPQSYFETQNFNLPSPSGTEIHLTTPQKYLNREQMLIEAASPNISKTQRNEISFSRNSKADGFEKHSTTPAQILHQKLIQTSCQSPGGFYKSTSKELRNKPTTFRTDPISDQARPAEVKDKNRASNQAAASHFLIFGSSETQTDDLRLAKGQQQTAKPIDKIKKMSKKRIFLPPIL